MPSSRLRAVPRALSLLVLLGCAVSSAGAKDIIVAQIAPFSGSQAVTGKSIHAGAKLYLNYVNAQGGINGSPVRLLTYDDAQKPEDTVRLAKEVVRAGDAVALIGTVGTNNLEALIKDGTLDKAEIPLVGAVSGASSVFTAPGMFVVKASYHDEIDRLFGQLSQLTIKRIGLVYQDDSLGKDVIEGADIAARRTRVDLVARAGYPRNTIKVEGAVDAMLKADPQAIFLGATTAAGIEFVKQYRQRGGLATIYGLSIIDTAALIKTLGPDLARGYAFSIVVPGVEQRELPIVREYLRLKEASNDPDLSARSMEGFIAAKALVLALRSGANSPKAVGHALQTLRKVDLGGYALDFTARNRTGSGFVDFAMVGRDGKIFQ